MAKGLVRSCLMKAADFCSGSGLVPEIVYFGARSRFGQLPGRRSCLLGPFYRKTHWERWGASPPTFSLEFCGRRGRFDPQQFRISGPEALLSYLSPAVFKEAFYFHLGCPFPGEGPDGHLPSNIDSFGPVSVRIRG